ncbi:MAG TPA: hypothetical protein IAC31_08800 [Candidatus Faecousia intestinigallinarum]|nr:hypothetical protein [Candidatus Faecousia intestinigallinarum]
MKKIIALLLALCLVFALAACGADENKGTAPSTNAPVSTNGQQDPSQPTAGEASDGFSFTYNGATIAINAPAAPILEALGEPKSYTEEASCAFDGLDKTYYFGSFYMNTYPGEDQDYVFGFWFADDSVSTQEGIYIGATQAEVEEAYGADSYNGSNAYIVTKGETKLTVILTDGLVSSIQYDMILN